jgi:hypothetical protein
MKTILIALTLLSAVVGTNKANAAKEILAPGVWEPSAELSTLTTTSTVYLEFDNGWEVSFDTLPNNIGDSYDQNYGTPTFSNTGYTLANYATDKSKTLFLDYSLSSSKKKSKIDIWESSYDGLGNMNFFHIYRFGDDFESADNIVEALSLSVGDVFTYQNYNNGYIGNAFEYTTLLSVTVDNGVQVSTSPVPVPGAVWFFATGLLGLVSRKRLNR